MTDYYLRPDGNDANDGLANTAGQAFKTFTPLNAVDFLNPGDHIHVGAGSGYGDFTPLGGNFTITDTGLLISGTVPNSIVENITIGTPVNNNTVIGLTTAADSQITIVECKSLRFEKNHVNGGVTFTNLEKANIENNVFVNQYPKFVSLSTDDYGSFTFQHNTVISEASAGQVVEAMVRIFPENDTTIGYPYIQVYNNAMYRGASDPNLIFKYIITDKAFWDSFYQSENNYFQYTASSGVICHVVDLAATLNNTYVDFDDWTTGWTVWTGRDVLGGEGDFQLGDHDTETSVYSWPYDSILRDAALEDYRSLSVDIEGNLRRTFGSSDVGAWEFTVPIEDYTVFGFTSKLYDEMTETLTPTQCVLFMDYGLDALDCLKFQATFDGGSSWNTIIDTFYGVDYSEEAFAIPAENRGTDIQVRVELLIHDDNLCKADTGTPNRVDLEYFSEAQLVEKVPAGSEIDIYDAEYNFITRVIPGSADKFETYLAPGTYQLKVFGGGVEPTWTPVTLGHGTFFGRYSESVSDIWHQFYKAKAYTQFGAVQWASYMCWEHFIDQAKRLGGEPSSCPPVPTGDPYYPNYAKVRAGKLVKSNSGVDTFYLMVDPTLFPELV